MESAQDHLSSKFITRDKLNNFCDVMTWRHDVTTSQKWKIINIFELSDLKNHRNKKRINFLARLQAEIGESGYSDVMTLRHDVTASQKWKIDNIFELSDLKNHGNKIRINFLARQQTEI